MMKRGKLMNFRVYSVLHAHFVYCGIKLDQLSKIIFYSNTANLMNNDEKS